MQRTVLDGFSRDRILTPRDVRGDYPSLTEAVKSTLESQDALRPVDWDDQDGTFSSNGSTGDRGARGESGAGEGGGVMEGGWPKVDESRGMVLFVIDYQSINTMCRYWVRKVYMNTLRFFRVTFGFSQTLVRDIGGNRGICIIVSHSSSTIISPTRPALRGQ